MAGVDEAREGQDTPLNASLIAGIETISYVGTITFTKYVRVVLPLDGFVFWVKADQLSQSALLNASRFNRVQLDQPPVVVTPASTVTVKGSFHYATDLAQTETETFATNQVVFTAEKPIQDFNEIGPEVMFIGVFDDMRFAFSARGSYYRQANIQHYVGHAVYSVMASQIVDDPRTLNTNQLIVSNSLPIWLSMNIYDKPDYEDFGYPPVRLWPSFLAPQNATPPFGTVHIEGTRALSSAPFLDSTLGHTQLVAETARLVLYGANNSVAMGIVDFVNQFSIDTDLIGIMNIPAMRDEKRPQVEFNAIAQRKAIDFEVSYYQNQARDLARQLIKEAFITYYLGDMVAA